MQHARHRRAEQQCADERNRKRQCVPPTRTRAMRPRSLRSEPAEQSMLAACGGQVGILRRGTFARRGGVTGSVARVAVKRSELGIYGSDAAGEKRRRIIGGPVRGSKAASTPAEAAQTPWRKRVAPRQIRTPARFMAAGGSEPELLPRGPEGEEAEEQRRPDQHQRAERAHPNRAREFEVVQIKQ